MPAAIAEEIDCRLPDAASRAAAQDGAPGAVVGHADRAGVEQPASPGAGSRPRCSSKTVSVKVAFRISDVTRAPGSKCLSRQKLRSRCAKDSMKSPIIRRSVANEVVTVNATVTRTEPREVVACSRW